MMWKALCLLIIALWAVEARDVETRFLSKDGDIDERGKAFVKRIIGGQISQLDQWPMMVTLSVLPYYENLFNGALIHPQWVLTCAHAFENPAEPSFTDPKSWTITFADFALNKKDTNEFSVEPVGIFVHPNRDASSYQYDIALMKLPNSVPLSNYVNTVALPSEGDDFAPGTRCFAIGHQRVGDGPLDFEMGHVDLPIVSQADCQPTYTRFGRTITPDMICAGGEGGKDACVGDSGGPLICTKNNQQVVAGVISFGAGCGSQGVAGVYARVTAALPWISSTMAAN